MSEPPESRQGSDEGAVIIPIEVLTREATFRRFAELVRRTDPPPRQLAERLARIPGELGASRPVTPWRSVDDELAALVYDSEGDEAAYEGVRAAPGSTRRLTFQAAELTLEVEVTLSRPRSLACQIVPSQPAELEVRQGNGTIWRQADPDGTFHVATLAPGPLSLSCRLEAGPSFSTTWVRI